MYDEQIETRVSGIPCLIAVDTFIRPKTYCGGRVEYGYKDWAILDRSGKRAPWLERKLSRSDYARIEGEIEEHLEQAAASFMDDVRLERYLVSCDLGY